MEVLGVHKIHMFRLIKYQRKAH